MKKITLCFASSNPGKYSEFLKILRAYTYPEYIKFFKENEITVEHCPVPVDVDENSPTIEGNATLKMFAACDIVKCNPDEFTVIFGEDTAFYVRALNNEPGIMAKRWGGEFPSQKLISAMDGISDRYAYYACSIAYRIPQLKDYQFENYKTVTEISHGMVSDEIRGKHGFGYDIVFIPDEDNNKRLTNAELKDESPDLPHGAHRIKAISKMINSAFGEIVTEMKKFLDE